MRRVGVYVLEMLAGLVLAVLVTLALAASSTIVPFVYQGF
jgi:hypothetical protein